MHGVDPLCDLVQLVWAGSRKRRAVVNWQQPVDLKLRGAKNMPQGIPRNRPDHDGTHRLAFERNKRKILASQSVCGICGMPVDKSLKYPNPMSPTVDHIIPISRGGHPSDMDNLQLAHWICNRKKSDKLGDAASASKPAKDGDATSSSNPINSTFPLSMDWSKYRPKHEPGA
jgi:hypothetical protein